MIRLAWRLKRLNRWISNDHHQLYNVGPPSYKLVYKPQ